jgi:hypothetical protein
VRDSGELNVSIRSILTILRTQISWGEWHDGIVSSLMAWFKCLRHNQGIVQHLCRKQAAQWLLLAAIKRELAIDSCTEISPIQCHPSLPRGWWVVMHMPIHNVIVIGCDKDCVTLSFFLLPVFLFSIRTSLFSRPRFQKSQERKRSSSLDWLAQDSRARHKGQTKKLE